MWLYSCIKVSVICLPPASSRREGVWYCPVDAVPLCRPSPAPVRAFSQLRIRTPMNDPLRRDREFARGTSLPPSRKEMGNLHSARALPPLSRQGRPSHPPRKTVRGTSPGSPSAPGMGPLLKRVCRCSGNGEEDCRRCSEKVCRGAAFARGDR